MFALSRREGETIVLETLNDPLTIGPVEYNRDQARVGSCVPAASKAWREEWIHSRGHKAIL
jgi:sRNA-binding carbon storage regulator CsrA